MMGFRCLGFLKVSFMVVVVAFLICFVSKYLDFFFSDTSWWKKYCLFRCATKCGKCQ